MDLRKITSVGPSPIGPSRRECELGIPVGSHDYPCSSDTSLFSSSLPVLRHEKLNFSSADQGMQDEETSKLSEVANDTEFKGSFDELERRSIDDLLPDDDDLLAGIIDDFHLSDLPRQAEDLEEYDVFGSGGGIELDCEPAESLTLGFAKSSINDGYHVPSVGHYNVQNGVATIAGEHPYGEHPSRTLFVRNINSNVEDSELRSLFEQYGDIRCLYTTCKHRGFVMISYYDIRAARTAMRALQNKPLRRRKLDIHFSIPKDNPSEKDINQGTLVVFNLDPSVSNEDLHEIFGVYGEIKEIRETPHKRHHKFIEFYDVRAAEAALRSLNRSDIAGKRIKLEPSRPGGARRSMMQQQQLTQEPEQDEARIYCHQVGSPIGNSPPGTWPQFCSPGEHNLYNPPSSSPTIGAASHNQLSSPVTGHQSLLPNAVRIAPIGKEHGRMNSTDQCFSNNKQAQGSFFQHSHSFPEHNSGMVAMNSSSGNVFGLTTSNVSGIGTLTGPQFLWGSPPYSDQSQPSTWASPPLGHSYMSHGQGQGHGFIYSNRPGSFIDSTNHHHSHRVGSAPSGRHFAYFSESPDTSLMNSIRYGNLGIGQNEGNLMMNNLGSRPSVNESVGLCGIMSDSGSPNFRMTPPQRFGHSFYTGVPYPVHGAFGIDGFAERARNRRVDSSGSQLDSKKHYQLDLDKIKSGEDKRTTLMIKNIPNKYTTKMLLEAINLTNVSATITYDFFYLPIDFKNKCNVGYAFINMLSPSNIISFYEAFNGKKWEKFNSEKVASLAYARIQGKAALVNHFQNSSLMNEDKKCRPILFDPEGLEAGGKEPFAINGLNVFVRQHERNSSRDLAESQKNCQPEQPEKE